jgi:hypothetical protein
MIIGGAAGTMGVEYGIKKHFFKEIAVKDAEEESEKNFENLY